MRGGRYRPLFVHKVQVGLDEAGNIVGWHHRQVGQSILIGTPFEGMMVKDGIDATSVEGVFDAPYKIDNFRSEIVNAKVGVPVLWWRSVGHTHTAYVMETMIDEVARATGKDPVEFRRSLLADHPRHLAVLNLAAEKANWGRRSPEGQGARRGAPRILRHCGGGDRRHHPRTTRAASRSTRSSVPSIAASPSTPARCGRRWKAASASAWARSCMRN
jgi:CO/xanthine dehydrogenase Mo-binding subunit